MKRCLFVSLFVVIASSVAVAQDTAYKALRAIGAQRGEKALGQILSISGKSGRPEPTDWIVKLDDPAARGGVRELNIANGQITGDRAPLKSGFPGSRTIDLTNLNLDSDGAFHVAEEEARRNQVGFDSVNYSLSSDPASGKPVWILDLFDYDQQPVGAVRVAADSGNLISGENWMPGAAPGHYAQQRAPLPEKPVGRPPPESAGNQDSRPTRIPPPADYREPQYQYEGDVRDSDNHAGETVGERAHRYGATVVGFGEKVLNKTERAARRIGGWFQKRLTGTDTISPPDEPDADNPSVDPYSRPVQPANPDRQPAPPPPE
ncbi:MAG: hypothetical protein WB586_03050 [Chthoniobacterales bacterium]